MSRDTRFKKGQSGNPNGRPKGTGIPRQDSPSALQTLRIANEKIVVREGDRTSEISKIEAVRKAQYKTALGGNSNAQRHILDSYERAEAERAAQLHESIVWWMERRDILRALFEREEKLGHPEPTVLPHPDDIVIDADHGVSILGPVDEEGRASVTKLLMFRDTLIVQHQVDERLASREDFTNPLRQPGSAMVLFFLVELCLPKRHRLTDRELFLAALRYRRLSTRELLKEAFRRWQAAGLHFRRGTRFPPQERARQILADHLTKSQAR